jgi:NAD+ synthase
LRENQTDQDSLPPYDMLDAILERLVEHEEPLAC